MTMQIYRPVGNAIAMLPTIAGTLLICTSVAHTMFTGFIVPQTCSNTLWSLYNRVLPIPAGISGVPEIDPGSAANAVTLLIGLTLVFVSGRRGR